MHPDLIDRRDLSLGAQAPRAAGGARDGEALHQGADPRGVPQPDQLRPRLVRHRDRVARHYFGKTAARLTLAEAATLAALPKSPRVYDPIALSRSRARTPQYRSSTLMAQQGFITPSCGDAGAARARVDGARTRHARRRALLRRRRAAGGRSAPAYRCRAADIASTRRSIRRSSARPSTRSSRARPHVEARDGLPHPSNGDGAATSATTTSQGPSSRSIHQRGRARARRWTRLRTCRRSIARRTRCASPDRRSSRSSTRRRSRTAFRRTRSCPTRRWRFRFRTGTSTAPTTPTTKFLGPHHDARGAGPVAQPRRGAARPCASGWTHGRRARAARVGSTRPSRRTRRARSAHRSCSRSTSSPRTRRSRTAGAPSSRGSSRAIEDAAGTHRVPAAPIRAAAGARSADRVHRARHDARGRRARHGAPARYVVPPNIAVAGKTGTTNDNVDVWFVGMTPDLVAGVWLGFDRPKTITPGVAGGSLAAPIWAKMVSRYYGSRGAGAWAPPGLAHAELDRATGAWPTARRRPSGDTRNTSSRAPSHRSCRSPVAAELGTTSEPGRQVAASRAA